MLQSIEGKLLDMLNSRNDHESTKLLDSLKTVCKVVEPFIDALPHQGRSLTGANHIRGIVHEIENLISGSDSLNFSSAEIYILLVAILTHDIGKLDEEDTRKKLKKKSRKKFDNYKNLVVKTLDIAISKAQTENLEKKPHPLISAYELLLHPTKYGLFDKELAILVAIVAFSHCEGFKENDSEGCAQKLTEDKYLAHYGKIRVSWLCALLTIGDELDTSYHRALPTETTTVKTDKAKSAGASKGEFRSSIGGCRIDLVGRCIVVYPVGHLKQFIHDCQTNKDLYQGLAQDVFKKSEILKAWETELMQMYVNVQDCLVEVDGHLLKAACRDEDKNKFFYFLPAVEPTVNTFKVSRVIEAMFKLKYGVFKKKYFSWEMLQSESGFENQKELKLIVHRISRLARLFSYPQKHKFICPEKGSDSVLTVPFSLEIQELDMEWTIEADLVSKALVKPGDASLEPSFVGSWFIFFVDSIILSTGLDGFWNQTEKLNQILPGISDPFRVKWKAEKAKKDVKDVIEIRHFFVHPGNEQLTYLLDEVTPCPSITPRGIELPKFGTFYTRKGNSSEEFVFNPRLLGMNLVIAGPPGIGKSTLALDIISNLSIRGCDGLCSEHEQTKPPCCRIISNAGAVAYFSLEQPIFTIQNLAKQLGHPKVEVEQSLSSVPVNPQSDFFSDNVYNDHFRFDIKILEALSIKQGQIDREGREDEGEDEYIGLFNNDGDRRVLLLPRLSPRFVGEQSAANERRLFWQRFKQISRLIESSFSVTAGDPFHPKRLHAIVIDNINSFLNEPMAREYIFKLFKLISFSGLLGIFILEDPGGVTGEKDKVVEEVQFLSDIWIELAWTEKLDYKMKMFEVKKSRYQRHVFGSHPFKIRFKEDV